MTTEEKIKLLFDKHLKKANRKLEDLDYEMNLRFAILSVRTKIKITKNHNEIIRRRSSKV